MNSTLFIHELKTTNDNLDFITKKLQHSKKHRKMSEENTQRMKEIIFVTNTCNKILISIMFKEFKDKESKNN